MLHMHGRGGTVEIDGVKEAVLEFPTPKRLLKGPERAFAHQRCDSLARGASGFVGRMGPGFSRKADGLHG